MKLKLIFIKKLAVIEITIKLMEKHYNRKKFKFQQPKTTTEKNKIGCRNYFSTLVKPCNRKQPIFLRFSVAIRDEKQPKRTF